jgi:hypothetical protein
VAQAQEISDAVRFSQDNLNGTARFRAMGGAFGALGGDLSAINVNPAGSVIFSNNQVGATLSNFNVRNKSNYFGSNTIEDNNSFDLNQLGAVFVFKNTDLKSDWKKFSLSINFENTNDFNNSIFSAGTNLNNSIDQYFLSYANNNGSIPTRYIDSFYYSHLTDYSGNPILNADGKVIENHGLLSDYFGTSEINIKNDLASYIYQYIGEVDGLDSFRNQQAFLGYESFLIDPLKKDDPNNARYVSLVPKGRYYHENEITTTGYNGKVSFNGATSYQDKLFLGINLNTHFVDYTQSSSFYEDNNAPLTSNYSVSSVRFNNELSTYGNGFSFQLGAILKATKAVRLGLAYESPTYYNLTDEVSQSISVVSEATDRNTKNILVDPRVTNIYSPYTLQTPSKTTGSFAYIFGKTGLLSIDYALKDYTSTQYKPNGDFNAINDVMASILDNTTELRIGGEYKIKQWSLRGGYRFEQSPYKNKSTMGDLKGYSGGLGYNFGAAKFDLSYSVSQRNTNQSFFSQGFTDGAAINTTNNNVSLTVLFEL